MKLTHFHRQLVLIHVGLVALGLSSRCLRGDENPSQAIDPIQLADARRVTQVCEEVIQAFPPGDRLQQWKMERDNLLAAVQELPAFMRREGSAVREGFAWQAAGPVLDDTFDIRQSQGFLAPHRPGSSPGPSILHLRAQYFDLVKEGMSPEDVAQILGKPDDSFEQNTVATGYQKTVLYALAGNRTAFLWFGSDDRLTYKYPNRLTPMHIEAVYSPGREPRTKPAVATPPVAESRPPAPVPPPASVPEPAPVPPAAPAPSTIRIGDTVVVSANSSLRTERSTICLQTDLRLCVVDVRGDQIGCLLRYADGGQAVAWVDKSYVVGPRQAGASDSPRSVPGAAPPRGDEQLQQVVYTSQTPAPSVRPQPNVYGSSIITFDNQSGEPALVRLVGPTREDVHVSNGGRSSIRGVAPGQYVVYVRYGTTGAYRYTRGEHFSVREYGPNYSHITLTLHAVPSGNYSYRESSEAEFNLAIR